MKRLIALAILAVSLPLTALAQEPASTQPSPPQATPAQKQDNAASATQDTSGTTGDQITKPAAAKGTTLIGCLQGPNKDGKYTLRSMSHRTGVQVLGASDDLKSDTGSKVKLTGQWQTSAQASSTTKEMPRFQATDIEVLAQRCSAPSEVNPVDQNKPQKTTIYNAPSSDNPK